MKSFSMMAVLSLAAAALPPIEVRGNAFYPQGSDERFYIRGIDYQPGGASNATDPLADESNCKRDVPYFKDLGVNAIRVYTIDNSANHDSCMQMLDDAGIYLILDVNTPKNSLNRADENSLKLSYNSGYLQHVFATIDAFKGYNNTLGFFAANEVINAANNTLAAPYIKAVVRDMKHYISKQADRTIPVGYSAADVADNRWQQMAYLNCGDDPEARIDMFGMNDYSWCGDKSSFEISGYAQNVENYSNYSIPLFLSEYGCNINSPRTFPEVGAIYSDKMSAVYSGGLVYEYSEEPNHYGLVQIDGDSVTKLMDYNNFKNALANAQDPSGDGGAKTDGQPAECPSYTADFWEVPDNYGIPSTPKYAANNYFKNGAGKPLGFSGNPTQWGSSLDDPNAKSSSSSSSQTTSAANSKGASSSQSGASSSKGAASSSGSATSSKKKNGASAIEVSYGALAAFIMYLF